MENNPKDFENEIIEPMVLPFEEEPEEDIVKEIKKDRIKKKHRRKKKLIIKSVVWVTLIVILSVALSAAIIVFTGEYFGIGANRGREVVVEIERGMSTHQIAAELKEAGAINSELAFRIYSRLKGYDGKYSFGVYNFNNEVGYEGLAEMLMNDGAEGISVLVTIPEMANVDEIAALLETAGVCTAADFKYEINYGEFDNSFVKDIPSKMVHYRFEGYLFPDTYYFYSYESKECAHLAVKKMLDRTEEVLTGEKIEKINQGEYSLHEILTMASIVELEASGAPHEMGNVAQVFYNRLSSKGFATLGSSPTRKYPYGNGSYNTYVCKGLPVGPLCSPSLKAIEAAIYPNTEQKATYFVTDKLMNFYYNTSLSAHNSTIAKLQRENNWIYED